MLFRSPYRTLENVIEGAVITFVDITETKRATEALRVAQEALKARQPPRATPTVIVPYEELAVMARLF